MNILRCFLAPLQFSFVLHISVHHAADYLPDFRDGKPVSFVLCAA